jgi:FkbM family methyltransferase
VVWDVGANIGYYSWYVRQPAAVERVVMIEPDPTNYALIKRTIERNGCHECTALNMALADGVGEREFLTDPHSGACGSLLEVSETGNEWSLQHTYALNETITCHTATVDSLIAEGTPVPGLMKIDVEGGEELLLAGAANCLAMCRPVLIVETANPAVMERLRAAGYQGYRIDKASNFLFIPAREEVDLGPFDRAFERLKEPGDLRGAWTGDECR